MRFDCTLYLNPRSAGACPRSQKKVGPGCLSVGGADRDLIVTRMYHGNKCEGFHVTR